MTTKWEIENNYYVFTHFLDNKEEEAREDAFKRHLLLELLDYLKVLEYSRGYDGLYYDITIKRKYETESR